MAANVIFASICRNCAGVRFSSTSSLNWLHVYQRLYRTTQCFRQNNLSVSLYVSPYAYFSTSNDLMFKEDHDTKSLTILDNVRQVKHSPVAALVLGFAGLIPLMSAPAYMITCGYFMPSYAYAQLAYGATVLSFIGGVRWGLTLPQGSTQSPDWHNLGYSVMPSLIAWGGLLASPTLGIATVIGGLALTGYMDIAMWGYPTWFKGLRFCLTFIAVLSLWTTLMCQLILADKDIPKEVTQKNKMD